ncbi:MAG TPA: L-seryl-tRNA(Sec) selenium transferase [Candidatus Dormibacteraeota bacterium]|nr:L-seryl-tRNA(Sec) selenium transferase [Candidatus Dormibacteraeota bacterium]
MENDAMRGLPAVHRLLEEPNVLAFEPLLGREVLKQSVHEVLAEARAALAAGAPFDLPAQIRAALESASQRQLQVVLNGTGVLVHTNLGRAPLARAALDAAAELGAGYSNLEFELRDGVRGSRYERVSARLALLFGAQDSLVVNNCAAAMLLLLDTFARGRECIVARSELVEIGGGFRIPDVLERSGAILVEIGTTNKVHLGDVERALTARTSLILRTHRSNFSLEGFVADIEPRSLAEFAKRVGVMLAEDLGSGAVVDMSEFGLPRERTARAALEEGASLVAISGDKLFGGPQCGMILGSAVAIARMRANPLLRALRVDKVTLAMLDATARLHENEVTRARIPLYGMLAATLTTLRDRGAQIIARAERGRIVETRATLGGGSLPGATLPSVAIALDGDDAESIARALRHGTPPIVARIEDGDVLLDLRSLAPAFDNVLGDALRALP